MRNNLDPLNGRLQGHWHLDEEQGARKSLEVASKRLTKEG